jgi:hypothetical protein
MARTERKVEKNAPTSFAIFACLSAYNNLRNAERILMKVNIQDL